ncbi:hypothetical protein [Methylorubrum extorquens]|jgi:hypothetical protein|uniref:hypothetical protein n=1 Tax=Methylorubrum extorquens TaxID=408 RepID=UPI001EE528DE|nr:hypothetical protein [Methylorubrum extorquens]MCG5245646.1 hypothetical protein [Methylorubrum extorquens]
MKRVFLTSTPSHRNASDLFDGGWASDLSEVVPNLIRVLAHHGLTETTIIADDPSFVNGPGRDARRAAARRGFTRLTRPARSPYTLGQAPIRRRRH